MVEVKLIYSLRKYGVRGFFSKWKEGIENLTPERLLQSEIIGYIGSIIATVLAVFVFIFIYKTLWVIAIIMAFNIMIQGSQLVSKLQQKKAIKMLQHQFEIKEVHKE